MEYTNKNIQDLVGLTHRQVIYLTEKVLRKPEIQDATGRGSTRLYSSRDLFKLMSSKLLRDLGLDVNTVARAVKILTEHNQEIDEALERLPSYAQLHLVDGKYGCFQIAGRINRLYDLQDGTQPVDRSLVDVVEDGKAKLVVDLLPTLKDVRRDRQRTDI